MSPPPPAAEPVTAQVSGVAPGGRLMLLRILRNNLRPYQREMVIVVILPLAGAIASLYLLALTTDIINTGVVQGDRRLVSERSLG